MKREKAPKKEKDPKKRGKGLKIFLCILGALVLFFAAINLIPPKKVTEKNPFIKEANALPMIAAHRGGGLSNPENTLMAFRAAVNDFGIQICDQNGPVPTWKECQRISRYINGEIMGVIKFQKEMERNNEGSGKVEQ